MKSHFKLSRICSSDNYDLSRRVHEQFEANRNNCNKQVTTRTNRGLNPYIKVFDSMMPISQNEVNRVKNSASVIWR